ncbi:hypothetical protein IW262DRAFT_1336192 [Armillaria fumosa]|nr:hypothetical protein IW262DRAFT_1336192 [Armillaria fumosa]
MHHPRCFFFSLCRISLAISNISDLFVQMSMKQTESLKQVFARSSEFSDQHNLVMLHAATHCILGPSRAISHFKSVLARCPSNPTFSKPRKRKSLTYGIWCTNAQQR